jgi:hypothetical protein
MNEQILFDRLRYMDKLKSAGIPEAQARAHADAMDDALRESVATKGDVAAVKGDIALIRADLKSEIARVEAKIDIAVRDLTIRLGGMIIAGVVILAAIKFFDKV